LRSGRERRPKLELASGEWSTGPATREPFHHQLPAAELPSLHWRAWLSPPTRAARAAARGVARRVARAVARGVARRVARAVARRVARAVARAAARRVARRAARAAARGVARARAEARARVPSERRAARERHSGCQVEGGPRQVGRRLAQWSYAAAERARPAGHLRFPHHLRFPSLRWHLRWDLR